MRPAVPVTLAALAVSLLTACGAETPDYQSLWATTTTTSTTLATTSTGGSVPISAYLESVGVQGQPVAPEKLTDLTVTVPRPKGWEDYTNPNLAPGTRVIARGETYPTAMLMVFRLDGDFDVTKALEHADVDAETTPGFKKLNGSKADFHGFPSSMIEGTYDLNGQRMQAYNRMVIAHPKSADGIADGAQPAQHRYLIQLTVTSFADDAKDQGPDIEAILAGFTVAAK